MGTCKGRRTFLKDGDSAASATTLYIAHTPAPSPTQALALQLDLLKALMLPGSCRYRDNGLCEAQAQVFPRHGFAATPEGKLALLKMFDSLAETDVILELSEAINRLMGGFQQVYDLKIL